MIDKLIATAIADNRHAFGTSVRTAVNAEITEFSKKLYSNEIVGLGLRCAEFEGGPCQSCTCSAIARNLGPDGSMRAAFAKFLPWGHLQLFGGSELLIDWNGFAIALIAKGLAPLIIAPDDQYHVTGICGQFRRTDDANNDRVFAATYTRAAGLGLIPEIRWRFEISNNGTEPLESWSHKWRRRY